MVGEVSVLVVGAHRAATLADAIGSAASDAASGPFTVERWAPVDDRPPSTPAIVVIVADDDVDPFERLRDARARCPDSPAVLVAPAPDAALAVRAVNEDVGRFVVAGETTAVTARSVVDAVVELVNDGAIGADGMPPETLLERLPVPVFAIDADHRVTHWNRAIEGLTGRSFESVADANDPYAPFYETDRPVLADLVVDGDEAAIEAWYADEVHSSPYAEDGYVGEGYFTGVDRWLQFAVSPIDGADGRPAGAIEALFDITPRKERERELERYETVLEASGDPVYTLDARGVNTFVNDALVEMTGYDRADLVGSHVGMVMDDEDVRRGERLIRRILRSPDEHRGTFEMDVIRADGERIACENHVAILPAADGEFRGTVGVLRDISDRKLRERRLQEERDRFTAVFETIPEPIAHVSFETGEPIVRNVNSAFAATFGFDPEELRGRSIDEAIVPTDLLEEARSINSTATTDEFVEREVRRHTADGERRDFLMRATRFAVGEDARESIVAYIDITEQKEHQRDLERQNERLDEFASVVSHDLRNPLNVAKGRLELARAECASEHLDSVDESLDRMEALIESLLALAVQGDPVREFQPMGLSDVVERSWAQVETGETARLSVDGDVTFYGSPERVRSLFENLFRNAVEHVGPDVSVAVGVLEDGFAVEDDGPGLPADREAIFEPGYSTNPGGTGFGLNIVREVVEAHGWTIRATDGSDGGARFEITGVDVGAPVSGR